MEQPSTLTKLSSTDIDALMRFLADEGLEAPELQTIPQRANRDQHPLSFGQTRLWFLDQLEPGNTSYNVAIGIRLQGPLNVEALQQSLFAIVCRHEPLRASFVTQHGQPVQMIAPAQPVPLTHIDLRALPSADREQEAHRCIQLTEQQPFDLAHGPLLRAMLLRLDATEHILALIVHHIIFDGWSEDVLYQELALFYSAYATGTRPAPIDLPIQYADYAAWQQQWMQGSALEHLLAYWTRQLAGAPALLELPTDRPRPATQTFRGATHYFTLPRPLADAVATLGQGEGCTLFMTLLAAFQVLLARYTRQNDIAVGSPIAHRTRPETEGLIGLFINTLVLRSDLSGSPSFRQVLRRVREMTLDAYTHQDLPFEQLVESLKLERNLSYTPLFQAMFVLQDAPAVPPRAADVLMQPFEIENSVAKVDLLMELVQTEQGIRGELQYNIDLFEEPTIRRMAQHFLRLLEELVAHPDCNIELLPVLTDAEQQMLTQWNDTARCYPQSHCLHTLIEQQVQRTPDAVAVVFEHQHLSYAELDRRANQLAQHLQALGVGTETLVGICVERSLELVVGLVGILKAGAAYVPFDPSYPHERLAFMLADAQTPVLLTQQALLGRIQTDALLICLDTDWPTIAQQPDHAPACVTLPENSAYAIYTSGSTGKPKGAVNTHRGICNRLLWMQETYQLTESDRVLQKTPFSFDVSVWEFFWPLIAGAALVVAWPDGHRDSAYLARLIAEQQITTLHFVPSMLQIFLDEDLSACRSLRRVICSGEALSPQLQQRCLGRLDAELHNLYGPTEAAVDVTFWECKRDADQRSVPIGRPIANTQIHLLDAHLRPVPVGVAGELHIGGLGLARGYLNRPELTAEKFIPNPLGATPGTRLYRTGDLARYRPDGTIEFLGRIDHQVKIRGFRIELGEIEAALASHAAVREAVATTRSDGTHTWLAAYIVPTGGQAPNVTELRNHLQTSLPDYMLPATFVFLDALPLTPTGKLDRRALPAPEQQRPELEEAYVAPRTIVEEVLTNIWADVLKIPCVGIRDNFFALGGDSIRSVGVLAQARERGIQLSLQDMFRYQTIADLSEHLQAAGGCVEIIPRTVPFALVSEADRHRLPPQIEDAYPLTSLQMGMLYHMELTPDAPDYHNLMSNYFRCPYDFDLFCQAVQQIVDRHPALRTSIDFLNYSEPLQLVHRVGTLGAAEIGQDDIRYLTQSQQEQVVIAFIESEARRPLDISQAPLLRFHLHRRTDEAFQITFTEFHPILDGWSSKYLMSEVFAIYLSLIDGQPAASKPALESSFRDYVCLERMALQSEVAQRFWMEQLQDVAILRLPRWPEAFRDHTSQRVRRVTAPISAELSAGVQRLAAQAGVPVKTILLTAHLRVMSLLCGQSDVMTGMVSHGRLEQRDGEQVYGLFLNSLPFRLGLTPGSWLDFVRRTFEAECEAIPFRRYPVAAIQQQLGSREPLFEVLFNYTNFHPVADLLGSGRVEDLEFTEWSEPSSVPLQVGFFSDPVSSQVGLRIEYHTSELCNEQVWALAHSYVRILSAMVQDPTAQYEHVAMLSEAETQRILIGFNTTAAPYATDRCMHQLFEAQAAQTPDAVAVVCEGSSLSYGELNRQANQLAHHLKSLGLGRGSLVAVYMERCLEMIPALLGILKAGAAYVPIERKWPANRVQWILSSLNIEHMITRHTHLPALEAIQPSPLRHVICLQAQAPAAQTLAAPAGLKLWTQAALSGLASDNPPPQAGADDLAYIIFTSGSTGTPKGVMVRHKPVINLIEWVNRTFAINPTDRVLFITALSFDLSVYDIFGLLAAGASIQVVPDHDLSDPARLLGLLCDEPVTFWDSAPAAFQQLVPFFPLIGSRGGASRLRLVFFSGDWIPVTLPDQVRSTFPCAQVIGLGGATEATVWSNVYPIGVVDPRWRSIPYGKPIQNARYHVLDRHLNPCPIGTPGDLYIGGECLAAGYVNEPLLTAQKFIPDPFDPRPGGCLYRTGDQARYWPDGNIEFLGRNDHQVKIRGFRIELGEIEAVLSQHPAVRESVVLAREDTPGEKRLVAYVVTNQRPEEQAAAPGAGELRLFLQAALPDYMVPSAFVFLEALPLSATKKVDRRALPAPDQSRPDLREAYVAPRTPVEQELSGLWAQVLRIERVGVEDDFFDLGGNSLLATRLVTRVRDQFQIDVTLRSFFDRPTVTALADQIEQARWAHVSLELAGAALPGEREEGVL